MAKYHNECHAVLKDAEVFPIEVDLSRSTFTYDTASPFNDGSADDDNDAVGLSGDVDVGTEADSDTHSADDVDLISTDWRDQCDDWWVVGGTLVGCWPHCT